ILVGATVTSFISAPATLDAASQIASSAGVPGFTRESAAAWLQRSRREVYDEIDHRLEGFARCGVAEVDVWADSYRVERRIALARALVLLAVSAESWVPPPRQEYIGQLLDFFERRVTASVQRGPLVRLTVSRSSS